MSTFVGIDLGTTNSVVAHRNRYGRPEVIANREGQNITPSVIYFGTDPPAVGQEAKEWARLGDSEIASFFKPHMGSALYQLQFHGKTFSATDLAALVLKRLKLDAEAALGDDCRSGRDHRARLLRRRPAQGHDRRRQRGRVPGAADHQRADRRDPRLRPEPRRGSRGDGA